MKNRLFVPLSIGLTLSLMTWASSVAAAQTAAPRWNLTTGAYAPDSADTSGFLPLSIALDTLTVSSSSPRLTVANTSSTVTTVSLDGKAVMTLTKAASGLTVRSTLNGATHVAYQLSGTGKTPLTLYSENTYKLALKSASITSADGPALNLQSRATAFIELSGTNSLKEASPIAWNNRPGTDGKNMDLKATLFTEGAMVFSGSGSLSIAATKKHALASDQHVRIKSGSVTLSNSVGDGLRAKNAFIMDGGTLKVTTPAGKGIKVDGQEHATQPLGFITVNAGSIAVNSHDKAMTASWEGEEDGDTASLADDPDPRVTLNGGTLNVTTTGKPFEDRNLADGDDSLSPEGIEAKSVLTINGGTITARTTDDALNAGTGLTIAGGRLYLESSNGDAADSNGSLNISGGVTVAVGAEGGDGALDNDRNTFAVKGGVFVGIGGRNSSVTASASSQNVLAVRNVSAGQWTLRDASGKAVFSYQLPKSASAMLLSTPQLTTGSTYSVVTGGTLGSVGETFYGLSINPITHSGGTVERSVRVSERVVSF